MVRETWARDKGATGWNNVVTESKANVSSQSLLISLSDISQSMHGSKGIWGKGLKKWAHWNNVLLFTDPDFSSTRRAISIILEKEMEENEDEEDEEGKGHRRKEKRRKTDLQGLSLCWSSLKLVQLARARLTAKERVSWEIKAKRHSGDTSVLSTSVRSLQSLLRKEETPCYLRQEVQMLVTQTLKWAPFSTHRILGIDNNELQ